MEMRFVTRKSIKLAGYALETSSRNGENTKAVPRFWEAYMSDGRMKKLHAGSFVKNHDEYGVCFPKDADGGLEYVIGVEINEESVPAEYHTCEIPAASYAVFSTPPAGADGFSKAIQQAWSLIWNKWFPESGRRIDEAGVCFELYDERCMTETGKVCEIWIPIIQN